MGFYHPNSANSKALITAAINELNAICPIKSNRASQVASGMTQFDGQGYGEIRSPMQKGVPSALIEVNFHDNTAAAQWIINSKDAIAAALVKAIVSTFGIGQKSGTTPATPTPSTGDDAFIWAFFKGKGLNDYAIAGLMGNLYAESGLKATNLQNSYEKSLNMTDDSYTKVVDNGAYTNFVRDCAGYGLAQWTYWSRKQALLDFAKAACASIGDFKMQLDFLWKELQGYTAVVNVLKTAKTVTEASNAVLMKYEKPADQSAAVQAKRAGYGQGYYEKFAPKPATPSNGGGKTLYRVQCGAFAQKTNADALAVKIKAKGHETYIVQAGGYYKVQCGAFEVKANADKLAATLKSQGFETFITT